MSDTLLVCRALTEEVRHEDHDKLKCVGHSDYLPVFVYWMQSPWFLNGEPSARFTLL